MNCNVWKPCRDLPGPDKHWFSIYRLLSNLLLKIIIYFVTAVTVQWPPYITQSRSSVTIFKFSILTFLRSMICSMSNEHWAKIAWREIFQLQFVSNAITCIDAKNSGKSCLFILCHLRITTIIQKWYSMQKLGSRLQNMTSHILFFR